MNASELASSTLLLFSHDQRVAETRQWVLEWAQFRIIRVYGLAELEEAASRNSIAVFLLCNSLPAELRADTVGHIRDRWHDAKILVFVPSYPLTDLPADEFFHAMEGPGKLIRTLRCLIPGGPAAVPEPQ